jgi:hypothetical protein
MKLLGITDKVNTCDSCGKTNLKCTVAFVHDDLNLVYYVLTATVDTELAKLDQQLTINSENNYDKI